MTKAAEPWKRLLESHDLYADLYDLYEPELYISYARRFDRNPHPVALVQGVHETAQAYVEAKWRKRAVKSQLLKHSGVHLIGAGLAARRLAYALSQISKSDRAATIISLRYERQANDRPRAQRLARFGPQARLQSLIETSEALEAAIASFITLPDDPSEEKDRKPWALKFVENFNAKRCNHAIGTACLRLGR